LNEKKKKAKSLKVLRNTKDFCFHIYARQRKKKKKRSYNTSRKRLY